MIKVRSNFPCFTNINSVDIFKRYLSLSLNICIYKPSLYRKSNPWIVSLVGASKPFSFANLATDPEIQSTSSGSPFSRSNAVDAPTSEGSSFTRAQICCPIEEEGFIPYARAVSVVSNIIVQNNEGLNSAKVQGGSKAS